MKNKYIDKIFLYISFFLNSVIIFLFLTILQLGNGLNNIVIDKNTSFTEIVFVSIKTNKTYKYYDYNQIFPRYQDNLVNADVFISETGAVDGLFAINYKTEKIASLGNDQLLISKNLAAHNNIRLGDYLQVGANDFLVVDFLPPYKGFGYYGAARDGIILLSNMPDEIEELGEANYMFFSDPSILVFNGLTKSFTKHEYLYKPLGKPITMTLILSGTLLVAGLTIIPFFSSDYLKRKIKVLMYEKQSFFRALTLTNGNIVIPSIVFNVLAYLLIYFGFLFNLYHLNLLLALLVLLLIQIFFLLFGTLIFTTIYRKKG